MDDLGLTHLALPVQSLARSIDFYARYADLSVVHRRDQVAWLGDGRRPFVIVLIEQDGEVSPLRPEAHIGVALASRDEVDQRFALARSEGCVLREPADFGEPIGYWGYLRDPDGHTLELSHGQRVALANLHGLR